LLKMLKQFQFLDQNGKDQGINVRNRAKELADLLSDVEKIRAERKKARANRNKFGGVEGGRGIGMGGGGPSKYGGFGSEDAGYGGYSGGVYGDGGGFGGAENSSNFHDNSTRRDKFEEYDEGDDAEAAPRRGHKKTPSVSRAKVETPKKKEPEVDLFDFGDNDVSPAPPPKATSSSNGKQPANNGSAAPADDDDFDDFISATPEPSVSGLPKPAAPLSGFAAIPPPTSSVSSSTQFAAPKPVSAAQGNTMSGMVGLNSISPAPSASTLPFSTPSSTFSSPPPGAFQSQQPPMAAQPPRPTGYQAPQPNYFTSISVASAASSAPAGARPGMAQSTGSFGSGSSAAKPAAAKSSGDAFGSLWSTASASAGIKTAGGAGAGGPKLGDLAKQKATAGIWGAAAGAKPATPQQQQQQQQQAKPTGGSAFDDLLG
jgi:epsin